MKEFTGAVGYGFKLLSLRRDGVVVRGEQCRVVACLLSVNKSVDALLSG